MNNRLLYILGITTAVLSSCHDDEVFDTLSGTAEKTPLMVSTNLNLSGSVQTRAVNKEFEKNDEFMACIRHVIDNNGSITQVETTSSTEPSADFHPKAYATFLVGANPTATDNNGDNVYSYGEDFSLKSLKFGTTTLTTTTTPIAALYWDDFSSSSSEDKYLRTTNHKLQSYYGYCFNGASLGSGDGQYSLKEETGVLVWKIQTNQSSVDGFKKSDLLWSLKQNPIEYSHGSSFGDSHNTLTIPFTHAMSKITINVTVDDSFLGHNELFKDVDVFLKNFRTSCELTPTVENGSISYTSSSTIENLQMHHITSTSYESGSYEAIVVPSVLKLNDVFATICVAGNNYNIPITQNMIQVASSSNQNKGWGEKLTDLTSSSGGGYQMQQGVNYVLDVKLYKTKIGIVAQIKAWDAVTANGQGDINFKDDVTEITVTTNEKLLSFDLWQAVDDGSIHNYDKPNTVDDGIITKATKITIGKDTEGKDTYTYESPIYWKDGLTKYYFRALSKADNDCEFVSVENSFEAKQGIDLLWGTTSEHDGTYKNAEGNNETKHYAKSDAINPRTGTVPMIFEHAMSKISVELKNADGIEDAAKVDLGEAKISIASLYDGGTIELEEGKIGNLTSSSSMTQIPIKEFYAANDNSATTGSKLKEYVVIPQSLVDMNNGSEPTPRNGTVSFYNKAELTVINGKSYATSTLGKTYFSEEEVIAHNADIAGAVTVGAPLTYTYEQFKNLKNSEVTEELFNCLIKSSITSTITYNAYIAQAESYPFAGKTEEDFITIRTSALNEVWWKHNDVSAKAYNAKLPGALHTTDQKGYEVVTDSKEANPGDLKVNNDNPKVMMLIMLKDGTTYTVDLAKCTTSGGEVVTEWKRGNHYTYTISLSKEKISFRALIKEWEEKTGSGNATLDWD